MPTSTDPIEFGDGGEPWSVDRFGVKRWLHCRVDIDALPDKQRDELSGWLATRGAHLPRPALLVTRGDGDGYRIHVTGAGLDVGLAELPVWLQRPVPPSPRVKRQPGTQARR